MQYIVQYNREVAGSIPLTYPGNFISDFSVELGPLSILE